MPKKSNLLLLLILVSSNLFSQKLEVGMGVGPTYYKGDLQPNFRVFAPSVGTNAFVRYNFSKSVSIKGNGAFLNIKGNDAKSGNQYNTERGFKFSNTLIDYNGQIEYNFLNFRTHNGRYEHKWTPYLFGGFGMYKVLDSKLESPEDTTPSDGKQSQYKMLPFGIGFKKIYKGKWNFGVEFSTRVLLDKNYQDKFDGFGGINTNTNNPNSRYRLPSTATLTDSFRYPNSPQKDLYYHVSFSVSYLFYKVHCP
ncbi:type IX secretion system protein PorG [Lacihabitans lacunae]|jgi:hypothetical protein|uniref:DUF6089 family protein n=1 Tax=Lacihabitans lacunae TaxID=1028214 RepID=A0ABV7YUT8_9BACT